MFALLNVLNQNYPKIAGVVISKHFSEEKAILESEKFQKMVKAKNGKHSFIPTLIIVPTIKCKTGDTLGFKDVLMRF